MHDTQSNNNHPYVFTETNTGKLEVDMEVYKKVKLKYNEMPENSKQELLQSMSWYFLTDEIIKKTRLQIQANMKKRDIISLFLGALGVLTNILASFNYINFEKVEEADGKINK